MLTSSLSRISYHHRVVCQLPHTINPMFTTELCIPLTHPHLLSLLSGAPLTSSRLPSLRVQILTAVTVISRRRSIRLSPRVAKAAGPGTAALQNENATLKETVGGLERERDFYFSKLRDIELLIQQAVEEDPELEKQEDGLVKSIQAILYSTEEGFEIPAEGDVLDDQETF